MWTGRWLQGEQGAGEPWSCLPLVPCGQAPCWLLTGCPEGRVDPPLTGLAPRPQQLPDEVKRGCWCADSRGVPAAWGSLSASRAEVPVALEHANPDPPPVSPADAACWGLGLGLIHGDRHPVKRIVPLSSHTEPQRGRGRTRSPLVTPTLAPRQAAGVASQAGGLSLSFHWDWGDSLCPAPRNRGSPPLKQPAGRL